MFRRALQSLVWSIFMLGATTASAAEATLELPRDLRLQLLDGEDPPYVQLPGNDSLQLSPGPHQIVVIYAGNFSNPRDTQMVHSQPIVLDFATEADQQLELRFPKPRTYREAIDFAEDPEIFIVHAGTGDRIAGQTMFVLPNPKGIQFSRDYQQELVALGRQFNPTAQTGSGRRASPAAAPSIAAAAVGVASATDGGQPVALNPGDAATRSEAPDSLEMLKYWYQQADRETRKDFQRWIIDQQ